MNLERLWWWGVIGIGRRRRVKNYEGVVEKLRLEDFGCVGVIGPGR